MPGLLEQLMAMQAAKQQGSMLNAQSDVTPLADRQPNQGASLPGNNTPLGLIGQGVGGFFDARAEEKRQQENLDRQQGAANLANEQRAAYIEAVRAEQDPAKKLQLLQAGLALPSTAAIAPGMLDRFDKRQVAANKPRAKDYDVVKGADDRQWKVYHDGAREPELAIPGANAGPLGDWTLEDMRKEYDYSKYTSESRKAAEKARDPSFLTEKPSEVKFTSKLSAAKHVAAQLQPFSDIATDTEQAFSLLRGDSGPEELGGLIKYAKALDPGSVVREGEVTMQQQAAGIVSKWENMLEALTRTGSALSGPQKQGIFTGLKKLAAIAREREGFHREHYSEMLEANDIGQEFMPPAVRWKIPEMLIPDNLPDGGPTGPGKSVSFNDYRRPRGQ